MMKKTRKSPGTKDPFLTAIRQKQRLAFPTKNQGKNPQRIQLKAEPTGDSGIYQEIRVGAMRGKFCLADVLVGLNDKGEVRVLVTTNGDGEGEHAIEIYPQRPSEQAVRVLKSWSITPP